MQTLAENTALAQDFLTALKQHDWALMRQTLTEDVVWNLPGISLISGEARGAEAVIARAQLITRYKLDFKLKHILHGPTGFALSLNNVAQRESLVLDEHLATVCTVRDGRITRIDTYLSNIPMMEAFFSQQ